MKFIAAVLLTLFVTQASGQKVIKFSRIVGADSIQMVYDDVARLRGKKLPISKDPNKIKSLEKYALSETFLAYFTHGTGNFSEVIAKSTFMPIFTEIWDHSKPHKKIIKDRKQKSHLAIMVEWEIDNKLQYGYIVRYYND